MKDSTKRSPDAPGMRPRRRGKALRVALLAVAAVVVLLAGAFFAYVAGYSRATPSAIAALDSDAAVQVVEVPSGYAFLPVRSAGGLLGDLAAAETAADAAARMAAGNCSWPVAALAEIRRRMVAQGTGRILVISSVAAIRVRRSNYLYGGAKAGLDRLCEGLADSLLGTGVTLQILRPGFVRSKMTTGLKEAPFTTGVDEVADVAVKGLSSHKRVITSPPVLAYVFALLRHLPAPLWRKIE